MLALTVANEATKKDEACAEIPFKFNFFYRVRIQICHVNLTTTAFDGDIAPIFQLNQKTRRFISLEILIRLLTVLRARG